MVGQTLAHYKILEKIGSGGMGDVYLAEDTKLDRKVALKVLPPDLAENEERRARFQREAKAIAALDHPNIVQVFSVEEAEGTHFITMQLVQGKTLTELLPKNGFPLNKFFEIAIPLADAVAAAHQEGITHRDLKPDNVMVSDEDRVKVLDFGLAKAAPLVEMEGSEFPTKAKTREGSVVGTLHYMSPEQAQGKAVDARSDIFSLGVVLYQILTGSRPFEGETPAEVLSNIIKDTPHSVSEVHPWVPHDLAKLIRRCLAKDPIRRYQSAIDLRNDLEETKQEVESGSGVPAPMHDGRRSKAPWAAAAVTGILVIGWVVLRATNGPSGQALPRFTNPVQLTSAVGVEDYPTWSPDGQMLAYAATTEGDWLGGAWDIWVQRVGSEQPVNRTADHPGDDRFPSWSPDGSQIAFWSSRNDGGYHVMPALGGEPRNVTVAEPMVSAAAIAAPPQWSPDGTELAYVATDDGDPLIVAISLSTGRTRRWSLPSSTGLIAEWLSWSPDGQTFAFVESGGDPGHTSELWLLQLADGAAVPLTDGTTREWSPSWSPDSSTLYFVSGRGGARDLWQLELDAAGRPSGDPQRLTTGMVLRRAAVSPDGKRFAYSRGRIVANLWRAPVSNDRPATWADAEPMTFDQARIEYIDVAPDGRHIAFDSDRTGSMELWMLSLDNGSMHRLTHDPAHDMCPRWAPDGRDIAFFSLRSGNRDAWVMSADAGIKGQITVHEAWDGQVAWSPDGRQLAFESTRSGSFDIWVRAVDNGEPRQLTSHAGLDWAPDWSPDGDWILFHSDREGRLGLWRVPSEGGSPELVTERSADYGRWSRDGSEVYFTDREASRRDLWAVSVKDRHERRLTELSERPGVMGPYSFAVDRDHIYFTWEENLGDIWVMDVVR